MGYGAVHDEQPAAPWILADDSLRLSAARGRHPRVEQEVVRPLVVKQLHVAEKDSYVSSASVGDASVASEACDTAMVQYTGTRPTW